jgi:hypothetical protein
MKKITIFIIFLLTLSLSTYQYLEMSKTEHIIIAGIKNTLLSERQTIYQTLKKFESEADELVKINDLTLLPTKLSKEILSICVLDVDRNFSKGWKNDIDGNIYEIENFTPPNFIQKNGWADLELNVSLRTSRGFFIIPTITESFLLISFNLSSNMNSLRSLSYGFKSYAFVHPSSKKALQTSLNTSPWERLQNKEIHLEVSIDSNWTLIFTGTWGDVYPYSDITFKIFYTLIILWGISIISLTFLVLEKKVSKQILLWTLSFIFNALCLAIATFLFSDIPNSSEEIIHRTNSFKKTQEFFNSSHPIILIPTAVYVDSLSFPNDTSFLVSGFIAQIYPVDTSIEMGFLFPYQSTLYDVTVKEISRWKTPESTTVLWHFGVGLTTPFSTKFFPFDRRTVEITLWPKELHKNIVFFPDFLNYTTLNAIPKPGFDESVNPIGWSILNTTFILKHTPPYEFFIPSETDALLTYVFAIFLERDFLGAFLSNILVLILCIFVAFLILFIPRDSLLDSLFATISIFVGLIFIAVTNHSSLRGSLEISSFAYVEYLFISFYILLLAITIDFILTTTPSTTLSTTPKLDRNFVLAILYWPTLLGSFILMLSLSIFL